MTNWTEKRAELERKLLEVRKIIIDYEKTPRLYRTVTDSKYKQAKRDIINISTAIHEGNYEANKPTDPLEGMSLAELKDHYKRERMAYDLYINKYGGTPSTKMLVDLMRVDTHIQMKQNELEEE